VATDLEPTDARSTIVEALDPVVLADIACGIAEARDLWGPHAVHDPADRHPVRLLATDAYEVWVIGWTEGQGVDLHDHAGSIGALVVTEGALREVRPGEEPVDLRPGAVRELTPGLVHEVFNPGSAPATSIHVYSPPLVAMGYYDATGERSILLEHIVEEQPALAAEDASRALHPASGGGPRG
jgi:predicted metal-dependent enzyme (double-stranded beta helix superfamily)